MLPCLAVTLGDVCGIGPEITIKALDVKEIYKVCKPVVIGDANALKKAALILNKKITILPPPWKKEIYPFPNHISLLEVSHLEERDLIYGKPTKNSAKASVEYIKTAVTLALEKKVDGIITCPVNKAIINEAGIPFSGHTELLARLTKTKRYAMLFWGEKLKVALLTIHEPLKRVPLLVTEEKLIALIELVDTFFKKKFKFSPSIAVAGLNPHAGERGLMGEEEIKIITPTIEKAKKMGINVNGPFPPDTVFHLAKNGYFDIVIAMYHDQGLIPFKLLHFYDGVNITIGLPIIRTSVDHGTAYDIAGKGIANAGSLISAICLAAEMAKQ